MSRLFEIHDPRGSRHLADGDLPLLIGAAADAHIRLPSGRETEAYIGISRGHLFIQPAPASQVMHNDVIITTSAWIKSGDISRIGNHVLHYDISGDLVAIRVSDMPFKPVIVPPDAPHPDTITQEEPLPRVAVDARKTHGRPLLFRIAAALLVVLVLAAWFTLAARSLEIFIRPEADRVAISGFPPVIRFGQHYLGLQGTYTLKATKQGYRELEAEVVIAGRPANRYSFTMAKLPGRIDFLTDPVIGAEVLIDGSPAGLTPLRVIQVPAGEHRILVRKQRYLDFETSITVNGMDQIQRFDFTLPPAWSEVILASEPAGATIVINGEESDRTPATIELLTGTHTITFQKEKYTPAELELEVPAGTTLTPPPVVLVPAPGTLSLASTPAGATVTVDSVYQGLTPVDIQLSAHDEHTINLSLQGYENLVRKVTLAPEESRSMVLDLQPEFGTVFLTTDPPDAELYIDGKHHGKATGRLELQTHSHTLEFRAKGYMTVSREITPAKGYSRQVDIRLEPETPLAAAAGKGKPLEITDGHELLLMEATTFEMGASRRDPGRRANERLRTVQITRPYYIGSREVTNREYRRFKPGHSSGVVAGFSLDDGSQPVVNVSWDDAARYANWLSSQVGLEPFYVEDNGRMVQAAPMTSGYRLPFESEWAYAARYAGTSTPARYPWNGSFPPAPKSGNFADESARGILSIIIQGYSDSFPVTAPVASFPRNAGGLFDMGGNVSEWCHDYYSPYAGFSQQTETDPTGPASGAHHAVRGSSWRDGSITELRLSFRTYSEQGRDFIGFRIARFAQ